MMEGDSVRDELMTAPVGPRGLFRLCSQKFSCTKGAPSKIPTYLAQASKLPVPIFASHQIIPSLQLSPRLYKHLSPCPAKYLTGWSVWFAARPATRQSGKRRRKASSPLRAWLLIRFTVESPLQLMKLMHTHQSSPPVCREVQFSF